MATPIPSWYFTLVVVRKGDRFLLVQERKHGEQWYLPAGRVEEGETLLAGAIRETLEETGVPVILEGILGIQHTPMPDGSVRVRVLFLARPEDETPPKSEPDDESLRAAWVTLRDLDRLPLRGDEVRRILEDVSAGAMAVPLRFLADERAGFRLLR